MELSAINWKQIKQSLDELDDCCEDEEIDGFKLIRRGEWTQSHKIQWQEVIFQDLSTGKHYIFNEMRSGSPFTDYHYEDVAFCDVKEAVQKEVTIKIWEAKP